MKLFFRHGTIFPLEVFYKTRINTKAGSAGLGSYSEINFPMFI